MAKAPVPASFSRGKLELAFVAVSLRNEKMMPPILPLGFPLEAKLMRPRHGVDAILGDAHPTPGKQRSQPAAALEIASFDERPLGRGAPPAAVCLDVQSRHVLAHVLAVFGVRREPRFKIAFDHPLKLRARKFLLELGRADGAFRQDTLELLDISGNVWIGIGGRLLMASMSGYLSSPSAIASSRIFFSRLW